MRALVISDIHANLQALEAVLAAAPRHDAVWNLGDLVDYGANPNEVVELCRKLGGVAIRGNHELAVCDPFRFSLHYRMSSIAGAAAKWTQEVLTEENTDWLSGLRPGPVKPLRRNLVCVHAPQYEDASISNEDDAEAALSASGARTIFFGHTHEQIAWISNQQAVCPVRPSFRTRSGSVQFRLQLLRRTNRQLLNPGSVGQPRDGDWRAAFAIYDDDQSTFTWYRVPYDVLKAQRRIRRAGLPEILATQLREGPYP